MSKVVDDRVVSLQFDNGKFEKNVSTTMSTLDKLKQKLNLPTSSKALDNIGNAAKNVDLSGISAGVNALKVSFSALDVMAVTALSNITNAAIRTGTSMAKALTIDPIKTGFQEYETQIGSIQTILANTQSKGSNLQDVNKALAELNTYADKTIYNFTEMTRNIGTFTAAGVDLKTSVSSIKGIANLAAVSGSTSQQASSAMYQLSQALAAGRVSLMDWNSVVNAGMGGEVFQTALKRTATHMGKNVDAMIEKYGSFRESLTQGEWLTTEVLTETLTQLSGAYSKADLIAQGYTEEQATQISKLAETAVSAATEVKTFTQLWDTLKEAAQSGWTQTWQTVVGDFDEAKELLTGINNVVSDMISASSDSRNKLLTEGLSTGWKQLLSKGIDDEDRFKESIKSVAKEQGLAIDKMIEDAGSFEKMLKSGKITGDMLSEALDNMTTKVSEMSAEELKAAGYTSEQVDKLKELNQAVKDGSVNMDDFAKKMVIPSGRENIIAGLANVFKTLGDAIAPVKEAFRDIFPAMTGDQLYSITEKFKELTEQFKVSEETASKIKRTFSGVFSIFDLVGKAIKTVLSPLGDFATGGGLGGLVDIILSITAAIGDFFTTINNSTGVGDFLGGIGSALSSIFGGISKALGFASQGFGSFGDVLSSVGNVIGDMLGKIGDGIKWISDNVSFGDIFAGLAGGGIFMAAKKFSGVFDTIKESIEGFFNKTKDKISLAQQFSDMLSSVHDALESFTVGIKATTLLTIAAAIGILSVSIKSLSGIDPGNLVISLGAMAAMMLMLNISFKSLSKSVTTFGGAGTVKAGLALIGMAIALNIFASALKKISDLKVDELAKGLVSLSIGLFALVGALKLLDNVKINLRTSIAIIALAEACNTLADALSKFGQMSWEEIGRGLTAMGGALGEVVAAMALMNKFGGGKSILSSAGLLIAVQSLGTMADALKKFGQMSWEEIGRGLSAMGGALAELTIALGSLSAIGGFSSILGGTAILVAVQSLDEISAALDSLSDLSWEEIGRGLTAMGGALGELALTVGVLGKIAPIGGILGGAALDVAVESLDEIATALDSLSDLSWDEIGRGLTAMGGALGELSLTVGALGKIAPIGGILGGTSLLIGVQSLKPLVDALVPLGQMSWEEIGRGLTAMGGALTELAVVVGVLGKVAPIGGILGGGAILLGAQGLGDLADAFSKFGGMSWEEIKIGLVGMGGALTEVAVVTGLLGNLGGLGALLGSGSLLLGIQGLGDLADALKEFGSMSWDEIKRGLSAMAGALGETALGGLLNTFSGFGALSIAAIAEPLGMLADSVKKWSGVTVPEGLGYQLGILANGVTMFTFGGFGAGAIAGVAEPLGTLADSVSKWAGVTVPEGLGDQLGILADGVEAFTFGGFGAGAIAGVAEPLGTLADSVAKWAGVTVPEGMEENLTGLANGVKAFTFSDWGGGGMEAAVQPLTDLAGAVQAWNGVVVPEGMEENLTGLANGVKAFNLGWFDDFDVGEAIQPLKDLAGAVQAWNGITIPTDIGTGLTGLATGLKAMSNVKVLNSSNVSKAITDIGNAVKTISSIDFASVSSNLTAFASSLNSINVSTNSFSNLGTQIVNGLVNSINAGQPQVISAAQALANAAVNSFSTAVSGAASTASAAGVAMVSGIANGITSGISSVTEVVGSIINGALDTINGKMSSFSNSGKKISTNLANGIKSGTSVVRTAITNMMQSAVSATNGYYASFFNAGLSVASGFAAGIRSGSFIATIAAAAMANSVATIVKSALQVNSPSKVLRRIGKSVPEGFAQGISMMGNVVNRATLQMTNNVVRKTSDAVSMISEAIAMDVDAQPTIRPVVDLDNVYAGARAINESLALNPSVGVMSNIRSISFDMNARNQNGVNDDVVNAIRKLDKTIRDNPSVVNNINGITYDDGSNIVDAVATLVRAAKVERRS